MVNADEQGNESPTVGHHLGGGNGGTLDRGYGLSEHLGSQEGLLLQAIGQFRHLAGGTLVISEVAVAGQYHHPPHPILGDKPGYVRIGAHTVADEGDHEELAHLLRGGHALHQLRHEGVGWLLPCNTRRRNQSPHHDEDDDDQEG